MSMFFSPETTYGLESRHRQVDRVINRHASRGLLKIDVSHKRNPLEGSIPCPEVNNCCPVVGEILRECAARASRHTGDVDGWVHRGVKSILSHPVSEKKSNEMSQKIYTHSPHDLVKMWRPKNSRVHQRIETVNGQLRAREPEDTAGVGNPCRHGKGHREDASQLHLEEGLLERRRTRECETAKTELPCNPTRSPAWHPISPYTLPAGAAVKFQGIFLIRISRSKERQ